MTTGGGAEAPAVCCFSVGVQPEITAAEPITALRIMNVRRSTPGGNLGRDERGFGRKQLFLVGLPGLHGSLLSWLTADVGKATA